VYAAPLKKKRKRKDQLNDGAFCRGLLTTTTSCDYIDMIVTTFFFSVRFARHAADDVGGARAGR